MTLIQMLYFYTVCEYMSFTKAAEKLGSGAASDLETILAADEAARAYVRENF